MPTAKNANAVPVSPAIARTPASAIAMLGGFLATILIIVLIMHSQPYALLTECYSKVTIKYHYVSN